MDYAALRVKLAIRAVQTTGHLEIPKFGPDGTELKTVEEVALAMGIPNTEALVRLYLEDKGLVRRVRDLAFWGRRGYSGVGQQIGGRHRRPEPKPKSAGLTKSGVAKDRLAHRDGGKMHAFLVKPGDWVYHDGRWNFVVGNQRLIMSSIIKLEDGGRVDTGHYGAVIVRKRRRAPQQVKDVFSASATHALGVGVGTRVTNPTVEDRAHRSEVLRKKKRRRRRPITEEMA